MSKRAARPPRSIEKRDEVINMLVGELFALVGLAAGFFFFIFAAKYYGSILFVLIGKNKIENRLNWRNFNNHNNHNGNNGNHNGFKTALNGGTVKTQHNGGIPAALLNFYTTKEAISFTMGDLNRNARELSRASFPLWAKNSWSRWGRLGAALRWKINPHIQLFEQNHGAISNNGNGNNNHNNSSLITSQNGGGQSHLSESYPMRGTVSFEIKGPFRKAREFARAISPLWLKKTWGALGEGFRSIISPRLQLFGHNNKTTNNNHINGNGNGNGTQNGKGNGNGNNKPAPFVSIHLPFYNEKNVADRILTACTSLDYPNYEVIVADDSTDETIEILEKWKPHPKVKVLHREVRRGWKGGALNEALKQMDPKTEYVVVFDADFIPPSDIIQQFLPYFAVQGNGNNNNHNNSNNNHNNTAYNGNGNHNHLNNNHRTVNKNDYQRIIEKLELWYEQRELAVIQGYQWHYLNAGENWLTRGIRAEYSSSYVIERTCQQLAGGMKMISGSVFMIKADILKKHGWATSMTEDWELTLRLYLDGYKVAYTPYIQAPAECPSTIPQLVKQRMRWSEGHTYNAKKYFWEVIRSKKISLREKLEFIYFAPYYLQSFLFLIGTAFWFLSEAMHQYLPFWTQIFGWSLLLSNFLSLPLMGLTGLFLEKNVRKDLTGLFSFIIMSYVLVPFQAYASLKGLLEAKERGVWIRTLKTGKITEVLRKLEFRRIWRELLPRRRRAKAAKKAPVPAKTATNGGSSAEHSRKDSEDNTKQNAVKNNPRLNHKLSLFNGNNKKSVVLILLLMMSSTLFGIASLGTIMPEVRAASHPPPNTVWYLKNTPGSGTSTDPYEMGTGATGSVTMTTNQYLYWCTATQYMLGPSDQGTWPVRIYVTSKTGSPTLAATLYYNTAKSMSGATAMSNTVSLVVSTGSMTLDVTVNKPTTDTDLLYIILELYASSSPTGKTVVIALTDSTTSGSYVQVPENLLPLFILVPIIPLVMSRRKRKTVASQ